MRAGCARAKHGSLLVKYIKRRDEKVLTPPGFLGFLFLPLLYLPLFLKVLGVIKFTTALGVAVLISVVAVDAKHSKTDAERFARGLPPFLPARRGTPVAGKFHLTVALII
jgi:hypothetical protein